MEMLAREGGGEEGILFVDNSPVLGLPIDAFLREKQAFKFDEVLKWVRNVHLMNHHKLVTSHAINDFLGLN